MMLPIFDPSLFGAIGGAVKRRRDDQQTLADQQRRAATLSAEAQRLLEAGSVDWEKLRAELAQAQNEVGGISNLLMGRMTASPVAKSEPEKKTSLEPEAKPGHRKLTLD